MSKNKLGVLLKPLAVLSVLLALICASGGETPPPKPGDFHIVSEIESNPESPFYIDFKTFPGEAEEERTPLPVGVFDSGTGGLTVLSSILTLDDFNNTTNKTGGDGIPDFRSEHFVYLGDKANMPYGRYDGEGKSDFLKELIIKDVQFLLGRRYYRSPGDSAAKTDKLPVKAIVIACNTATAFGLDTVRRAVDEWGIKMEIMGIIDAGAKTAAAALPTDGKNLTVGVLATEGTCASNGYPKAVKTHFYKRFHHNDIAVVQQAGFGLAAAIDGDIDYIDKSAQTTRGNKIYRGPGLNHPAYPIKLDLWDQYDFETGNALLIRKNDRGEIVEVELNSVKNYIKYHVTHLVIKVIRSAGNRRLGAVILGCTHYPFFEKEIEAHFRYLKRSVVLIDPARALAAGLYRYLSGNHLLRRGTGTGNSGKNTFYISVPNPLLKENQLSENGGFREFSYAYKYGRSINSGLQFVKRVPFSRQWIQEDVINQIHVKMPDIYDMIFKTHEKK